MSKALVALLLMAGIGLSSTNVQAAGVIEAPMDAKTRASLHKAIAQAKASRPGVFARVASLRAKLGQIDADKRGRLASISPVLKRMGPDALMPLLQESVIDAKPRGTLTDSAWLAWRISLLEAIGAARDSRALPALTSIIEGPDTDFMVMRAASQAVAKLNSDAAANTLVTLSETTRGAKRLAILAGMGHCRRIAVAEYLGETLAAARSDREVERATSSLGDAGNAWAWETPFVKASGEEAPVRAIAAAALVEAFVDQPDGELRTLITQAVLVVDASDTPSLIASARVDADEDTATALDGLLTRFNASPLRR